MITDKTAVAAHALKQGKIVAFPTETVWGLGANAFDFEACKKIYSIKGRPQDNPLILHVDSIKAILKIAVVQENLLELLSPWIPGPLTMIFKKRDPQLFSCGLETIAVRVPSLEMTLEMLGEAGVPIAAPSANLSGKPSLTRFNDVVEVFEGKVDLILKGPDANFGIESTVIDFSKEHPIYVRPGVISFEELQEVLPKLQAWNGEGPLISPGMKYKHYSPAGVVDVLSDMNQVILTDDCGQIGFNLPHQSQFDHLVKNNAEYAKDLYAFFVECDRRGIKKVYCQIPKEGVLYQAILHRLEKAAYR